MNKHIETLLQLVRDNPNLEVMTIVDNEVVCGDEFGSWKGEIREVIKRGDI